MHPGLLLLEDARRCRPPFQCGLQHMRERRSATSPAGHSPRSVVRSLAAGTSHSLTLPDQLPPASSLPDPSGVDVPGEKRTTEMGRVSPICEPRLVKCWSRKGHQTKQSLAASQPASRSPLMARTAPCAARQSDSAAPWPPLAAAPLWLSRCGTVSVGSRARAAHQRLTQRERSGRWTGGHGAARRCPL